MTATVARFVAPELTLYGGNDPRDMPLYTAADVAQATAVPVSTVRAWVAGTWYGRADNIGYFSPVLRRPDPADTRLSFYNVIEVHVLHALRSGAQHVTMARVREALAASAELYGLERPLLNPDIARAGGRLFLDKYAELVELSYAGQLAMRPVLEGFLERVEYDPLLPIEFYPFARNPDNAMDRLITINPYIAFGRAMVARIGITTRAIADRVDAGELSGDVRDDYELSEREFVEALAYETAA